VLDAIVFFLKIDDSEAAKVRHSEWGAADSRCR